MIFLLLTFISLMSESSNQIFLQLDSNKWPFLAREEVLGSEKLQFVVTVDQTLSENFYEKCIPCNRVLKLTVY